MDDGDDEAPVESHRQADVDSLVVGDGVRLDGGVQDREGLEGVDGGLDDEREIREACSPRLEALPVLFLEGRHPSHVDLEDRGDVGRRAHGLHHALGGLATDGGHGHELRRTRTRGGTGDGGFGWRRRGIRGLAGHVLENVLLRDPPRESAARHLTDIDAVLAGDAPNHRGGAREAEFLGRGRRLRSTDGRCWRRVGHGCRRDNSRVTRSRNLRRW